MKLADHPTVKAYRNGEINNPVHDQVLDSSTIKEMAISAGAADAGIIEVSRSSIAEYRKDLLDSMPEVKSIMVLAYRVNPTPLSSLNHSVVDNEFKSAWYDANSTSRKLVIALGHKGIKALNMPSGFPFEMTRWPEKVWLTCEKNFAIEAGLGYMGLNRLVLHPQYGSTIILASVLLTAECDQYDQPLNDNPCINCGLCLKACPVGAVKKTDNFDFMACYTHNYRERLGGFKDWVQQIIESKNAADYRKKVTDAETISMWQHLAIGAQTKCDRCMAVCPAGEMAIGPYLDDRKKYIENTVKRFKEKRETIYVVKRSDAELHVKNNFPLKQTKNVSNGITLHSVAMFLEQIPMAFQSNQADGLEATYHFIFTGNENLEGTVIISGRTVEVQRGLQGQADLQISADSETWVSFLAKETHLAKALIFRKFKFKGKIRLMKQFAACFPS